LSHQQNKKQKLGSSGELLHTPSVTTENAAATAATAATKAALPAHIEQGTFK